MSVKEWGLWLSNAAVGGNGKEALFGGTAAAGGFLATQLGGWDDPLRLLAFLMVSDFLLGFLVALITKKINSREMYLGGIRKGVVFIVLILAVMCDRWVGGDAPIFRTLALYFYIGREGLSLIENSDNLGFPWPPALRKFLEQMKEKGDEDGK